MGNCNRPENNLLPWYANGTLEDEEEAAVRAHVQTCEVCQSECEVLGGLIAGLAAHPIEAPSPARPRLAIAVGLAALLVLPAMLGVYWAYLGFPTGETSAAPTLTSTASIDLNSGMLRSDGGFNRPAYDRSVGSDMLVFTFLAPVRSDTLFTIEFIGPDGAVLAARGPEKLRLDSYGRATYSLPADALQSAGDHQLVVREIENGEPGNAYGYPLHVR